MLQRLKALARAEGLWNLFLSGEHGPGLSNLDYAPVKEIMGRVLWAPEVFNCGAPNVGNMEILARFGTPEQQARWLAPMLAGEMKLGFSMTEPEVVSSDATNFHCEIRCDGDKYVINGRKWYPSDAMNATCQWLIVMGNSDPDHADPHLRQSMILVPKNTPGVCIVRGIQVMGYADASNGHPEIDYDNVRVPASHMLLGEGRGFEIVQVRLGLGRIHHCMRLLGCAQRAVELMCQRASSHIAFGKPLAEQGSVREDIARSWCEVEQARLLTLRATDKMDRAGNKAAKDLVAAAKVIVPARPSDPDSRRRGAEPGHFPGRGLHLRPLHAHWRRPRPGAFVGAGQTVAQVGRQAGGALSGAVLNGAAASGAAPSGAAGPAARFRPRMARPSRVSTSCQPSAWYSLGNWVRTNITATPKACASRSAAWISRLAIPWRRCITCNLQPVDPEPDHVVEWAGVLERCRSLALVGGWSATAPLQWRWSAHGVSQTGRPAGAECIGSAGRCHGAPAGPGFVDQATMKWKPTPAAAPVKSPTSTSWQLWRRSTRRDHATPAANASASSTGTKLGHSKAAANSAKAACSDSLSQWRSKLANTTTAPPRARPSATAPGWPLHQSPPATPNSSNARTWLSWRRSCGADASTCCQRPALT